MILAVWEKSLAYVCFLTLLLHGVTGRHNKNTRKSLPAMVSILLRYVWKFFRIFGTGNLNKSYIFIIDFNLKTTEQYGQLNEYFVYLCPSMIILKEVLKIPYYYNFSEVCIYNILEVGLIWLFMQLVSRYFYCF